jgi:hypothetical protein
MLGLQGFERMREGRRAEGFGGSKGSKGSKRDAEERNMTSEECDGHKDRGKKRLVIRLTRVALLSSDARSGLG